jgi:anti-sigma regulatory factor (Ser/Thr protein kinase)
VLSLQTALLPPDVPILPLADVAARYVPAGDPAAIGGDWFDAVALPDGRLLLLVGDVAGSGLAAVAVMGQLRAVLSARLFEAATGRDGRPAVGSAAPGRAAAVDGPSALGAAVDAAEALATRLTGGFATTLCISVLDPTTGDFDYLTLGHPAPFVLGAHGARMLAPTGDGPLGTHRRGRVASTRLDLGEAVVLFTDGLYPQDLHPDQARRRLQDVATGLGAPGRGPDRFCAELTEELGAAGFTDDVTVLAARRRTPPAPLDAEYTAAAERLGHARAAVGDWAEDLGLAPEDRRRIVLGVSELIANAIEHGYADQPGGPVRVHAELDGGVVRVTVDDEGSWRQPTAGPGDRGRGLSMSAALGLRVAVSPEPSGTRAIIETSARRPLQLRPSRRPQLVDPDPTRFALEIGERITVQVAGPLRSTATCLRLAAEVRRAARNGLVDVDLDLRSVTGLGSSAIAEIEQLLAAPGPSTVRVLAGRGSSSAARLALAGTPFEPVG